MKQLLLLALLLFTTSCMHLPPFQTYVVEVTYSDGIKDTIETVQQGRPGLTSEGCVVGSGTYLACEVRTFQILSEKD